MTAAVRSAEPLWRYDYMRDRRLGFAAALLCLCLALSTAVWPASDMSGKRFRDGEILVKFRPGASASSVSAAFGAAVVKSVPRIGVHRLKLKTGQSVEDAVSKLSKNPNVVWAAPNHVVRLANTVPDDEYFLGTEFCLPELDLCIPDGGQWGLYNTDGRHDIHAPEAWDIERGSASMVIAIVDTGIQSYHPDLDGKVLDGYNALDGSTDTDDDHMHGTFVASVAAANTNNYDGVAGVDWNARLMPIKVLNADGEGSEAGAAEGIIWAVDHGAKIINLSLGTYDHVQALEDAVNYAWNAGCVVVAASGNDDSDDADQRHYPSYYSVCISVGATNELDGRCTPADWLEGGSNYGDSLDVMAPGNNIYGAVPGYSDWWLGEWVEYEAMTGTSAAAPFVSGLASLIWAHNPAWTNEEVRDQIELTCDDVNISGWDRYTGWGRINAYRALSEPLAVCTLISDAVTKDVNSYVSLPAKVVTAGTTELGDRFYIEELDRSSGLMVYCGSSGDIQTTVGDAVRVRGKIAHVNGELALTSARVIAAGAQAPPRPIGMSARVVGGALLSYGGNTPALGLSNSGLLIKTWGWVRSVGWNYVYIEDGSSLRDGSGLPGLKVYTGLAPKPRVGEFISATGISGVESPPGSEVRIPVLRVRKASDIVKLL